ncbi:MAG: hemerythrin domain-containing protein [Acidimicrobiia bacterium]|nr:hemerythrin domain-containing protein [Acidimicrobiia bacterium]
MSEEFTITFREEHRQVRDGLMDLSDAFAARDGARAGELLGTIAALTGPHFRYEEETLYPSLVQIFGADYVDSLIDDHDGAIASARRLVELAGSDLDDAAVAEAQGLVRGILPHVSDCDGLSIMVERLSPAEVDAIFAKRAETLDEGLDLLTWDDTVRKRPALAG